MVAAVGVTAWGALAPFLGVLPFGAVARWPSRCLALRDFDLGAPASRDLRSVRRSVALLLLADFQELSRELLSVFGLGVLKFPESFRGVGAGLLAAARSRAAALLFLATAERDDEDAPAFASDGILAWFRTLRDLWNGNLLFGLLVVEAAALGFLAFDCLVSTSPRSSAS